MKVEICLLEPEIPANTGNIARTCVALGARLHLVGQLGFSIADKDLKRAGLDYWHELDLRLWDQIEDLFAHYDGMIFYATTKCSRVYTDVDYPEKVLLVFGKETRGLPDNLLSAHPERCVRIPMLANKRSLNLSNSVAILAYEVMRQHGFAGLAQSNDYLEKLL